MSPSRPARCYAGHPAALVYQSPEDRRPVHQLLWGTPVLQLGTDDESGAYAPCRVYGREGWIRKTELQDEPTLQATFVDVGSGDGTLVTCPDGRLVLVDAGHGDAFHRYLEWHFGPAGKIELDAAIVSHPDMDHYRGLERVVDDERFHVRTLYINGIVDRIGKAPLGPRTRRGRRSYLSDLVTDRQELEALLADQALWKRGRGGRIRKRYAGLLERALESGRVGDVRMLSASDHFLPGFAPQDGATLIEVLGPVVERSQQGKPGLRWLGTVGETKRGHSIVLRMTHGNVRVLLGGDPGAAGESLLLEHHTGLSTDTESPRELARLVAVARQKFESDVAKVCHHGGHGLTEAYLRSINAAATIASLGHEESNRMRPETIGVLGRHGRGSHPLIFSASEFVYGTRALSSELSEKQREARAAPARASRARLRAEIDRIQTMISRSISVHGAIYLATDGHRIAIARRLERPRGRGRRWAIYELVPDERGRLHYSETTRAPSPRVTRTRGLWKPGVKVDQTVRKMTPRTGDVYVAVDQVVGEEAILGLTAWPWVDTRGRLRFDGDVERREVFRVEDLQNEIDHWRRRRQQVLRPLRTGDVFHVRFAGKRDGAWWMAAEPSRLFERDALELVQDVTAKAREAAKMAVSAAIAPTLSTEESEALEPDKGEEEGVRGAARSSSGPATPTV